MMPQRPRVCVLCSMLSASPSFPQAATATPAAPDADTCRWGAIRWARRQQCGGEVLEGFVLEGLCFWGHPKTPGPEVPAQPPARRQPSASPHAAPLLQVQAADVQV